MMRTILITVALTLTACAIEDVGYQPDSGISDQNLKTITIGGVDELTPPYIHLWGAAPEISEWYPGKYEPGDSLDVDCRIVALFERNYPVPFVVIEDSSCPK